MSDRGPNEAWGHPDLIRQAERAARKQHAAKPAEARESAPTGYVRNSGVLAGVSDRADLCPCGSTPHSLSCPSNPANANQALPEPPASEPAQLCIHCASGDEPVMENGRWYHLLENDSRDECDARKSAPPSTLSDEQVARELERYYPRIPVGRWPHSGCVDPECRCQINFLFYFRQALINERRRWHELHDKLVAAENDIDLLKDAAAKGDSDQFDGTLAAHPAWWRGHESGTKEADASRQYLRRVKDEAEGLQAKLAESERKRLEAEHEVKLKQHEVQRNRQDILEEAIQHWTYLYQ